MFSCLGPDTLRELRGSIRARGWPPAGHEFTDMHDWGDMLVDAGFAEPVMDMERIVLTWRTPEACLAELRTARAATCIRRALPACAAGPGGRRCAGRWPSGAGRAARTAASR